MNTRQFSQVFFASAVLIGLASALGTLEVVTLNGAATVPLLSAAAGSLATPLAVLGVLKLGAAALLALSLLGTQEESYESSGYGRFKRRRAQRSADAPVALAANPDAVFGLAALVDTYGCGKQLICELEAASAVRELEEDEKLMTIFFKKGDKLNMASPKGEYDMAAELGLASKNELLCRARYAACPYTAPEMMAALRNAQI